MYLDERTIRCVSTIRWSYGDTAVSGVKTAAEIDTDIGLGWTEWQGRAGPWRRNSLSWVYFGLHLLERGLLQSQPPKLSDDGAEEELLLHRRTPEHTHTHQSLHLVTKPSVFHEPEQSATLTWWQWCRKRKTSRSAPPSRDSSPPILWQKAWRQSARRSPSPCDRCPDIGERRRTARPPARGEEGGERTERWTSSGRVKAWQTWFTFLDTSCRASSSKAFTLFSLDMMICCSCLKLYGWKDILVKPWEHPHQQSVKNKFQTFISCCTNEPVFYPRLVFYWSCTQPYLNDYSIK